MSNVRAFDSRRRAVARKSNSCLARPVQINNRTAKSEPAVLARSTRCGATDLGLAVGVTASAHGLSSSPDAARIKAVPARPALQAASRMYRGRQRGGSSVSSGARSGSSQAPQARSEHVRADSVRKGPGCAAMSIASGHGGALTAGPGARHPTTAAPRAKPRTTCRPRSAAPVTARARSIVSAHAPRSRNVPHRGVRHCAVIPQKVHGREHHVWAIVRRSARNDRSRVAGQESRLCGDA